MAYFKLEPFGDDLFDYQLAQLQALLANINRDPKKGRTYKAQEFALRNLAQEKDNQEEVTPGTLYQRFKAHLGL